MGGNLPLNRKCVTMPHMLQAARVRRIPKGRETMEQNNKNRPDPNGKKGGAPRGWISLVLWSLVLVIAFNYIATVISESRSAETSHEIAYSEFKDLVREGKVASVEFGDKIFTITPAEGFVYTDEDGKTYDKDYTLYTTIIPDGNEALLALLDEYNVEHTKPYKPEMSVLSYIMMQYVLPLLILVILILGLLPS